METSKHFSLQLSALIAFFVSLGGFISLVFALIELWFPQSFDLTSSHYFIESNKSALTISISILVVAYPAFLILTRMVNVARRKGMTVYPTLTKWLIYIALIVGGAALLGDFISVIYNYLEGEITIRFALKACSIFLIVGASFFYYLLDTKDYWLTHEKRSIIFGAIVSACIFICVIIGFTQLDTPNERRMKKIDERQIQDLNSIQWDILDYYNLNKTLPQSLEESYEPNIPPVAPAGYAPYSYTVIEPDKFELCAEFNTLGIGIHDGQSLLDYGPFSIANGYDWEHGAGRQCFERTIESVDPTSPHPALKR